MKCDLCDGSNGGCNACNQCSLITAEALSALLPDVIGSSALGLMLLKPGPLALDCEWNSKVPGGPLTIIGVGNHAGIVQILWQQIDEDERNLVRRFLPNLLRERHVIYHNADVDLRKLRQHGVMVKVRGHKRLDDTMLAHSVLHCEEEHSLEYLQGKHGRLPAYAHLLATDQAVKNAADIVETLHVWDVLARQFVADPAAERVYEEASLGMLEHAIREEERGIRVAAPEQVMKVRDEYDEKRQKAALFAQSYCGGWPLNLNAPEQVKKWVYDIEGFPAQYDPKTESPTLDKDALAELRRMVFTEWDPEQEATVDDAVHNVETGGHPLLEARYLHAGAQQAISHYIDSCLWFDAKGNIAGVRDRIYPELRLHVQTSGRHSYVKSDDDLRSGMALGQLRGKRELLIRPDEGAVWVGWDWANIETWILAVLAGDPLLLKAKEEGWDTHTINCCDIMGIPYPPLLTKKLHTSPECAAWRASVHWQGDEDLRRTFAKRFVYRLHYRGMAENAGDIPGARELGFDVERLIAASETYLGRHHWIVEFWNRIQHDVDHLGVVYSWDGRPRRLTSDSVNARYREASNHPMQAGVHGIYVKTRRTIHDVLPFLDFAYGKHDSQLWQTPLHLEPVVVPIIEAVATRPHRIAGQDVSFPISAKRRAA